AAYPPLHRRSLVDASTPKGVFLHLTQTAFAAIFCPSSREAISENAAASPDTRYCTLPFLLLATLDVSESRRLAWRATAAPESMISTPERCGSMAGFSHGKCVLPSTSVSAPKSCMRAHVSEMDCCASALSVCSD